MEILRMLSTLLSVVTIALSLYTIRVCVSVLKNRKEGARNE